MCQPQRRGGVAACSLELGCCHAWWVDTHPEIAFRGHILRSLSVFTSTIATIQDYQFIADVEGCCSLAGAVRYLSYHASERSSRSLTKLGFLISWYWSG
jgi:hypothetical protein